MINVLGAKKLFEINSKFSLNFAIRLEKTTNVVIRDELHISGRLYFSFFFFF